MSDAAALWRGLGRRQRPAALRPDDDFAPTRLFARPGDDERWLGAERPPEVEEVPIDTLPAELRDELTRGADSATATPPPGHG